MKNLATCSRSTGCVCWVYTLYWFSWTRTLLGGTSWKCVCKLTSGQLTKLRFLFTALSVSDYGWSMFYWNLICSICLFSVSYFRGSFNKVLMDTGYRSSCVWKHFRWSSKWIRWNKKSYDKNIFSKKCWMNEVLKM